MPGLVHIVDDDASFCTAIERRLKKAGYDVAMSMAIGNVPIASISMQSKWRGEHVFGQSSCHHRSAPASTIRGFC
jgi:hypothetical protein